MHEPHPERVVDEPRLDARHERAAGLEHAGRDEHGGPAQHDACAQQSDLDEQTTHEHRGPHAAAPQPVTEQASQPADGPGDARRRPRHRLVGGRAA
ncbi:hypothetical protein [Terrabacter sp. 2RAF25]|uniref:hypothetical protein n=1 Tax=Terrabacter sp. 2RAF25 TaxID=3232998 RepID=UPI003F94F5F5